MRGYTRITKTVHTKTLPYYQPEATTERDTEIERKHKTSGTNITHRDLEYQP
jgi:hypothetical protein